MLGRARTCLTLPQAALSPWTHYIRWTLVPIISSCYITLGPIISLYYITLGPIIFVGPLDPLYHHIIPHLDHYIIVLRPLDPLYSLDP